MQSQIDEINSDAHLRMDYVEFLEALARAADYLSLAPPSETIKEMYLNDILYDSIDKAAREKELKEEDRIMKERLEEEKEDAKREGSKGDSKTPSEENEKEEESESEAEGDKEKEKEGEGEGEGEGDAEEGEMTEEEHRNQPLHKKIDNIIPYLLAH
jgi:hypothetical protein